jgi:hypothetical protein
MGFKLDWLHTSRSSISQHLCGSFHYRIEAGSLEVEEWRWKEEEVREMMMDCPWLCYVRD